jgi:hypothetical protein
MVCWACQVISARPYTLPTGQGLTLVHVSAQREHFMWDTLGLWVESDKERAQVELNMDECKPLPLALRPTPKLRAPRDWKPHSAWARVENESKFRKQI